MGKERDIETTPAFYAQLFNSSKYTILLIGLAFLVEIYAVPLLDKFAAEIAVILISVVKLVFIVRLTFNQLSKIIGQSHLLSHILVLFGLLIGLIVVSFAVDYVALYLIDTENFEAGLGAEAPLGSVFFEYVYMSIITFSSVGFGDIVPKSMIAKSIVMLEVALRFFVLVFGIANINNIRVNN